jgi:hypothetical protein
MGVRLVLSLRAAGYRPLSLPGRQAADARQHVQGRRLRRRLRRPLRRSRGDHCLAATFKDLFVREQRERSMQPQRSDEWPCKTAPVARACAPSVCRYDESTLNCTLPRRGSDKLRRHPHWGGFALHHVAPRPCGLHPRALSLDTATKRKERQKLHSTPPPRPNTTTTTTTMTRRSTHAVLP